MNCAFNVHCFDDIGIGTENSCLSRDTKDFHGQGLAKKLNGNYLELLQN